MSSIDKFKKDIEHNNIRIIEDDIPIDKLKGLYYDNTIVIDKKLNTSVEKKCVLAEELGHFYTSSGNILDQTKIENRKQEKRARNWGYEKLVPLTSIITAYKRGCSNRYEIAEFLEVTEQFFMDAIKHYKEKYGLYYSIDNYVIYFEPLGVFEKFQ